MMYIERPFAGNIGGAPDKTCDLLDGGFLSRDTALPDIDIEPLDDALDLAPLSCPVEKQMGGMGQFSGVLGLEKER